MMNPYRRNAHQGSRERFPSFFEAWIVRLRHRHDATVIAFGIWFSAVLLSWLACWYVFHA